MLVKYIIGTIAASVPVFVTILDVFGHVASVTGSSMQPCLNPEEEQSLDYVYLNRWRAKLENFERGEVVTLISPNQPEEKIIKRIIALQGDTVRTLGYKNRYVTVPAGHCWIEGDNHSNSYDSNAFGPVPLGLITAKASHIVWPLHRRKSIERKVEKKRVK